MPIDRKRRIFRSASLWPMVLIGLLCVAPIGGVAVKLLPPAGRAPAAPETTMLRAEPPAVAVVDAATLRLADSVVRLRGVLAPRRGRACTGTDGHGFDCGAAAAEALAALVRDRAVACRLEGRDRSGIEQATCDADGADLGRQVIAAGWARAVGASPELRAAEDEARGAGRGLWRVGGAAGSF